MPSMEAIEQLMMWRDKNMKKTMAKPVCTTPHDTAAGTRKCDSKINGPNWSGYKPHKMRPTHKKAIWRSGYYAVPFQPNAEGELLPLPVPATSIPSLVKELAKVSQRRRDRSHSHSSNSSDTSSALGDSQSFRVPEVPQAHSNKHKVGRGTSDAIQIHEPPCSLSGSSQKQQRKNGVEAEASSFSFNLREPKGIKPHVHDEMILRGMKSPDPECRQRAHDILLIKQSYRSYTQNQLTRRENKFLDVFKSGRNIPGSEYLQKDISSVYKPLRDAAMFIHLNIYNPDPAASVQRYNHELIQYTESKPKLMQNKPGRNKEN